MSLRLRGRERLHAPQNTAVDLSEVPRACIDAVTTTHDERLRRRELVCATNLNE